MNGLCTRAFAQKIHRHRKWSHFSPSRLRREFFSKGKGNRDDIKIVRGKVKSMLFRFVQNRQSSPPDPPSPLHMPRSPAKAKEKKKSKSKLLVNNGRSGMECRA